MGASPLEALPLRLNNLISKEFWFAIDEDILVIANVSSYLKCSEKEIFDIHPKYLIAEVTGFA